MQARVTLFIELYSRTNTRFCASFANYKMVMCYDYYHVSSYFNWQCC